jgi:hypothetical protein
MIALPRSIFSADDAKNHSSPLILLFMHRENGTQRCNGRPGKAERGDTTMGPTDPGVNQRKSRQKEMPQA